ncbi:MAG: hypothetical protein WCF90_04260 [Methanomicrobiales archaeon]
MGATLGIIYVPLMTAAYGVLNTVIFMGCHQPCCMCRNLVYPDRYDGTLLRIT